MDSRKLHLQVSSPVLLTIAGQCTVAFDCELFSSATGPLPMTGITHCKFPDLTPELLADHRPALIILPLFGPGYDASSAIEDLERLHYAGRITVLAPALPSPRLVERELRALGPGARLTLVSR